MHFGLGRWFLLQVLLGCISYEQIPKKQSQYQKPSPLSRASLLLFYFKLIFNNVLNFSSLCKSYLQSQILEALGATVERVRPVSITHRDHFVNIAQRRASEANELALKHRKDEQKNGKTLEQVNGFHYDEEKQLFPRNCPGGYFADQFENLANFRAHYEGTGPEIWEQTGGNVDAFVAAAGTGGTVAGASKFLQVP